MPTVLVLGSASSSERLPVVTVDNVVGLIGGVGGERLFNVVDDSSANNLIQLPQL